MPQGVIGRSSYQQNRSCTLSYCLFSKPNYKSFQLIKGGKKSHNINMLNVAVIGYRCLVGWISRRFRFIGLKVGKTDFLISYQGWRFGARRVFWAGHSVGGERC